MMNDLEYTELFGKRNFMPIIAGRLFIGMGEGDSENYLEELYDFRNSLHIGPLEELIHNEKIGFATHYFEDGSVNEIIVSIPFKPEKWEEELNELSAHLGWQFKHDKVKKCVEYNSDNELEDVDIQYSDELFSYSISLSDRDDCFDVTVAAVRNDEPSVYQALITVIEDGTLFHYLTNLYTR